MLLDVWVPSVSFCCVSRKRKNNPLVEIGKMHLAYNLNEKKLVQVRGSLNIISGFHSNDEETVLEYFGRMYMSYTSFTCILSIVAVIICKKI